jgi:hypothetical protein
MSTGRGIARLQLHENGVSRISRRIRRNADGSVNFGRDVTASGFRATIEGAFAPASARALSLLGLSLLLISP